MNIHTTIKATNMDLTDAISSYVEEKVKSLEKLVEQGDTGAQAKVEVGKTTKHHASGDVFRAEINLTTCGDLYRSVSKQSDLYAAIDDAKDDLLRQLRKKKTRRTDKTRKNALQFKNLMRRLARRSDES